MKKILLPVLFSALGLAGCVAVPVNQGPYGYGPQVYVAPPALVVRPAFVFGGYGGYGGHGGYYRGGPHGDRYYRCS